MILIYLAASNGLIQGLTSRQVPTGTKKPDINVSRRVTLSVISSQCRVTKKIDTP